MSQTAVRGVSLALALSGRTELARAPEVQPPRASFPTCFMNGVYKGQGVSAGAWWADGVAGPDQVAEPGP